MPSVAGELGVARPAIVVDRSHRQLMPRFLVIGSQLEHRVEQVVALGKDVGGDEELVADDPLDGVAPAIELRADPLDHDAAPRADRFGIGLARVDHGFDSAAQALLGRRHGCGATLPDRLTMSPMPLPRRLVVVSLMSVALAACATPRASDSPLRTSSPARSVTAEPTSEPASAPPSAGESPSAAEPPALALEAVASGLEAPINITATPSGRLL